SLSIITLYITTTKIQKIITKDNNKNKEKGEQRRKVSTMGAVNTSLHQDSPESIKFAGEVRRRVR
ncbi:hypothetical protein, partial [Photobacterium leiognathi]|uniref:hypothetical protein n=1 Tax=Photobacterium leiognathi TaxID=553611 RepID=UPI002738B293